MWTGAPPLVIPRRNLPLPPGACAEEDVYQSTHVDFAPMNEDVQLTSSRCDKMCVCVCVSYVGKINANQRSQHRTKQHDSRNHALNFLAFACQVAKGLGCWFLHRGQVPNGYNIVTAAPFSTDSTLVTDSLCQSSVRFSRLVIHEDHSHRFSPKEFDDFGQDVTHLLPGQVINETSSEPSKPTLCLPNGNFHCKRHLGNIMTQNSIHSRCWQLSTDSDNTSTTYMDLL